MLDITRNSYQGFASGHALDRLLLLSLRLELLEELRLLWLLDELDNSDRLLGELLLVLIELELVDTLLVLIELELVEIELVELELLDKLVLLLDPLDRLDSLVELLLELLTSSSVRPRMYIE
jgi:hypothetical protein